MRGQAARAGQHAVFVIVAGVASYLNLVRQFANGLPASSRDGDDAKVDDFKNSENASPKKKTNAAKASARMATKYALSASAIVKLKNDLIDDFLSVLSCFCLKLGCQYGGI